MNKNLITVILMTLGLMVHHGFSQKKPMYVGVNKCKTCHKKASIGNQYKIWSEEKHSKAYQTLASDTAKIVAKKAGINGDPQKAPECLKCHVTAYQEDASLKDSTLTIEEGVSCESCHGPGSLYKKKSVMKDVEKAKKLGLIMPTEEVCKKCHNTDSPTYKEFIYEERVKDIQHPVPEKKPGATEASDDAEEEE